MPGVGFEPTSPCEPGVLSPLRMPIPPPGRNVILKEAWAGIAPAYKGFADPCLTTWLPRRILMLDLLRNYFRHEISKFEARRSKNYEAYTAYMLNNFCKAVAQIWESQ